MIEQSAISLFDAAEDYFSCALSDRHMDFGGAASAYCSNVRESPLNTLVIRGSSISPKILLAEARSFFDITNTPWYVVIRADLVNQENLDILANFGFMPHETSVAMVLSLDKLHSNLHSNAGCQNMDQRLAEWAIPLKAFPSSNNEIPLSYTDCHQLALDRRKNLTHMSLFDGDTIVSSVTVSWNNQWARIDDLATNPTMQRRGFASKLLACALDFAMGKRASMCFLEASPTGLSLYQKMGFKTLFKNQVFLKRDAR